MCTIPILKGISLTIDLTNGTGGATMKFLPRFEKIGHLTIAKRSDASVIILFHTNNTTDYRIYKYIV